MTTTEVIENYYKYVNSKNWTDWLTLFSDDVVGDEQLAGHFAGIDVLRGAVSASSNGYSQFIMTPQRIVVEGDAGCVIWKCDAKNSKGVPIGYREEGKLTPKQVIGANYFQIQHGKIVYMRTVHDSLPFKPFTNPQDF
jgi:hypothetical protein